MKRYLHVTGEGATPNSNRIPDGTLQDDGSARELAPRQIKAVIPPNPTRKYSGPLG
jgi:hypothetical protein